MLMTDAPDLSDPSLYINRKLSWLAFNQRVLAQAQSDPHPVLEAYLFDTERASILRADGSYEPATAGAAAVDAQQLLASRA